tara:strand:+ start:187 stop:849 length:663 start_codon:yes stop_codon:yes gene_type:complete
MNKTLKKSNNNRLLIIGCGGHAKVITEIAIDVGFSDIIYQDEKTEKNYFLGNDIVKKPIENYYDYFFVAIGDNFLRENLTRAFLKINPHSKAAILIHPSSIISKSCTIGEGTVVMPLCAINSSSKIGRGVIVNTKSSIDHDNLLKDYSSIAPGVSTGGNVIIGNRTAIAIGTLIKHGIEIGADSVIGSASYLNKNIPNNKVVYGSPAKIIRERKTGEAYF